MLLRDSAHRVHPLAGLGLNLGFGDVACLHQLLVSASGRGEEWGEEIRICSKTHRIKMFSFMQVLFTHSMSMRLKDRDTIFQSCLLSKACIDSFLPQPHHWCCSALWDSN